MVINNVDFTGLEEQIGYVFSDKSVIRTALTHKSYLNECRIGDFKCYERLEFLGDAILEFMVTDYIYRLYPDTDEGSLTQLRSQIVCERTLSTIAREKHYGDFLFLGKGESSTSGRDRSSTLCDVFESVLGAIYLDGGFDEAKKYVDRLLLTRFNEFITEDYKTKLTIYCQKNSTSLEFRVLEETGPAHDKLFTIGVYIDNKLRATGTGKSKKEAESSAAKIVFEEVR